jgi:hypothetical protein
MPLAAAVVVVAAGADDELATAEVVVELVDVAFLEAQACWALVGTEMPTLLQMFWANWMVSVGKVRRGQMSVK